MLRPLPHIRIANVQGDLVILDLVADDYLCLARQDAAVVWQALGTEIEVDDPILHELVAAHVVQMDRSVGKPWVSLSPSCAVDMPVGVAPNFRLRDVWATACATLRTCRDLGRRKSGGWQNPVTFPHDDGGLGNEYVYGLADRFQRLRCFIPRTGRCFVRSAMLRHFLWHYGIACDWVFGVQTHPFAAHCWIEARGAVLNDSAEHINWYTVIVRF